MAEGELTLLPALEMKHVKTKSGATDVVLDIPAVRPLTTGERINSKKSSTAVKPDYSLPQDQLPTIVYPEVKPNDTSKLVAPSPPIKHKIHTIPEIKENDTKIFKSSTTHTLVKMPNKSGKQKTLKSPTLPIPRNV